MKNIVEQAESDLSFVLEDIDNGFGVALTLIDEKLVNYSLAVQTTDIGFFIDPQSGIGVAGRQVQIAVRISTLTNLGGGYPGKKWKALYKDTNSNSWTMIVQQNKPDRKLGVYNLIMEAFKK